jgi:hypothetical protein
VLEWVRSPVLAPIQSKATEPEDALQVGEPHLDALALAA